MISSAGTVTRSRYHGQWSGQDSVSVLLVTMTTTSHYLLLFLLSGGAQCLQTPWSSLSLQGQASKRSAGLEETVVESEDDLDLAASETHYDAVLYNDDNNKPESRGGPYRRRKYVL